MRVLLVVVLQQKLSLHVLAHTFVDGVVVQVAHVEYSRVRIPCSKRIHNVPTEIGSQVAQRATALFTTPATGPVRNDRMDGIAIENACNKQLVTRPE